MVTPLKHVRDFDSTGQIRDLTSYSQKLYFTANPTKADRDQHLNGDPFSAPALWVTDGREEGTQILSDFAPGDNTFVATDLNVANDHLFFITRIDKDSPNSYKLWSYKDVNSDANRGRLTKIVDSLPNAYRDGRWDSKIEAIDSGLFFLQPAQKEGYELWFTDGTGQPGRTYSLGGNTPGKPQSNFVWLEGADNLLYFVADGHESVPGVEKPRSDPNELWVTSSTSGTFKKISDFDYKSSDIIGSPTSHQTTINDSLYFTGPSRETTDQNFDYEPWVSNGTLESTQQIKDINPARLSANTPSGSNSNGFTLFRGEVYFRSTKKTGDKTTEDLHAYNPTSKETRYVATISEDWNNVERSLIVFNDSLYFVGHTKDTGWELWESDGTTFGTSLVSDLTAGASSTEPGNFAIHKPNPQASTSRKNNLYFTNDDGKLWKLDGSTSTIQEVKLPDIPYGVSAIAPVEMNHGGNELYMSMGNSLYKLDESIAKPEPSEPTSPTTPETTITPKPEKPPATVLPEGPPQTSRQIIGTDQKDKLKGSNKADEMHGKGGKDKIRAKRGNDWIYGNEDDDRIWANAGDDVIYPGPSGRKKDVVRTGPGKDLVVLDVDGLVLIKDFQKSEDRINALAIPSVDIVYGKRKTYIEGDDSEIYAILKGKIPLTISEGIIS